MSNTATLGFSRTGRGLFTTEEVRALMQIEFERAQRYTYPIACMLIQVDHLAQIQTVHGFESKEEVLHSVVELVKNETRAGDLMGYIVDDRLVAVVPHTPPKAATALSQRLLDGARNLGFRLDGKTIRITLSIGLSHNQDPGAKSFATIERVAEEGLSVADNGGGDRCVQTELYQLYEKERTPVSREDLEELLARAEKMGYRQRLEDLVVEEGQDLEAAAETVADELIDQAVTAARTEWERELEQANAEFQAKLAESSAAGDDAEKYKREVDQLQRRIAKLMDSLDSTEAEISRLRAVKGTADDGVQSIYREVQGLQGNDATTEIKKELMGAIFQANLDLQGKRAAS